MTDGGFLSYCVEIGLFMIMAGIVLGFLRLVLGPTNADRIVALDMMTVSIVAFCALFAIRSDSAAFLDVAVVLALVGFLATVALARFAERQLGQRTSGTQPSVEDFENDDANTPTAKEEPSQ
jgi:multisubunit Na+/H+ antiporter MnhF subunit